jgi:hypothetical protein
LNRFLHTSRKQPEPETEPVPISWTSPQSESIPPISKNLKRPIQVLTRTKRKVKPPKRFAWDIWER